jgi:hypothetical protein
MERPVSLPCFIFEVVLAHLCMSSMVSHVFDRVHNEDAFNCASLFKFQRAMMDGFVHKYVFHNYCRFAQRHGSQT